jgi:hypothetical protein
LPALVTTVAISILLVGLSAFFLTLPFGWIFSTVMILIIAVSYLYSPAKYHFAGSYLIVQKVIGRKIAIPLSDVVGYTIVPDFSKLRVVRTFGNGGLFGYYGIFSTAEYGTINCQLRSLKNVIILKTSAEAFAVSPAEVERFESQLIGTVQGLSGKIEKIVPEPATIVKRASLYILVIPVVLFLLTLILIYNAYLQLPDRIAVHFDLQGNPDGWASRTSFIYSGAAPAAILSALSIGIFLAVRRATRRPDTPYFIVIMLGVFQLFTAFVLYDTYWVNKHNTHLIPFPYNVIAYSAIILLLLVIYYRKVRGGA